jgi:TonB family protein
MIELLTDVGLRTWDPFWVPVLVWTAVAVSAVFLLRLVPQRHTRLHLDTRIALLLALPLGILVANLLKYAGPEVVYVISIPVQAPQALPPAASVAEAGLQLNGFTLIGVVSIVGVLLSVVGLVRFAGAVNGLRRLVVTARPLPGERISSLESQSLRSAPSRLADRVRLLTSDATPVAFSYGIFRKRIVVPNDKNMEDRLVLIHEFIHHANGDVWRAAVGQLIVSLFFFHPLVHMLHRRTRLLVELSCDQSVLADEEVSRIEYAKLLLQYAGHRNAPSTPALSMADTRSNLYHRIRAMKYPIRTALSKRTVIAIASLVMGAGVFFSACSESALVGPSDDDFAENDVLARTMRLPAASGDPDVYVIVEYPPELVGGLAGLQENMHYPVEAKDAGLEGRVFLQFLVQPDGVVSDVRVTRSASTDPDDPATRALDEEAVRVVSEARFVPGVQDGVRVPVKMSLPITFRLHPAEPQPPVDVELVKRQLADGTYEFNGRTWNAVSEAGYSGRVFGADGQPLSEGWIQLENYDARFPIFGGGSNVPPEYVGTYRLVLPKGTWTATIVTPSETWKTTFVVDEKGNFEKDLRPDK